MTVITSDLNSTDLKSQVSTISVGFVSRLSRVLKAIARILADFNRYMDAAQQVNDVRRSR